MRHKQYSSSSYELWWNEELLVNWLKEHPRSSKGWSNKEGISSPTIGRPKMVAISCSVMVMKPKRNIKVFVAVNQKLKKLKIERYFGSTSWQVKLRASKIPLSFLVNLICSNYSFEPPIIRVKTPRTSAQIGRGRSYLKPRSNANQISIMVKVMPKKSDNIYHIISARKKVIMSFKILKRINEATKSYRLFFILIVRKLEKKDERTIGGRHGEIKGKIIRGERRRKQGLG